MRSLWLSLHERLVLSTEDLTFQQQFRALTQSHPALGPFADPGALVEWLHGREAGPDEKNRVLAALVAAARAGGAAGGTAQTLLWLALWPGLDAVHRRKSRFFRAAPEELVSEIAGRFTAEIARLDLSRVRRVAATLVRNVERDVRALSGPVSADEPPDEPTPTSLLGLPDGVDAEWATHLLGERLRAWIGADADIVIAIAVIGETSDEVAARLGMSPSAVRKRYRRALARLRERLEK